jgi:hypothetical protein
MQLQNLTKGGSMFTVPPMLNMNSNASSASVQQADVQANATLQSRFPGWSFLNGQYNADGKPQKAHMEDRSGRMWTVWFNTTGHITHIAQGNQ